MWLSIDPIGRSSWQPMATCQQQARALEVQAPTRQQQQELCLLRLKQAKQAAKLEVPELLLC